MRGWPRPSTQPSPAVPPLVPNTHHDGFCPRVGVGQPKAGGPWGAASERDVGYLDELMTQIACIRVSVHQVYIVQ